MRIISNFRDYYDSLMAYDSDRDIVYKRTEFEINNKFAFLPWFHYNGIDFYPILIGFCGEVYKGIHVRYSIKSYPSHNDVSYYSYEEAELLDLIDNPNEDIISCNRFLYLRGRNSKFYKKEACRHLNNVFSYFNDMSSIFISNNAPIFTIKTPRSYSDNGKVIFNCSLQQYNFQKVLDPYTAYQKLKSYVGGMAQPLRPIPELSDEVMQEIKGFDHKYSFRKEPRT